ncbi:hypothetical protein LOTGIDRAFT_157697 [Lottia gigantea]|uniref:Uncharacterized protein n=1 Tax=Lottia gigantea TaxID=225164 RepID=V4CET9_LOTGI|nr:hypothetical protein LOTGIDRAFT_157697 [Lottia gigantea]ESP00490.1 hypothetical protein LOTGIDRAFT_157697 [Lottia gigantea]
MVYRISLTLGTLLLVLFFADSRAQEGCMCQAIDDNARDTIFANFGPINTCADLAFCACETEGVAACRRACERIVQDWSRFECPGNLRQREVRARYAAGECKLGFGDNTHNCRARRLDGFLFGNLGAAGGGNNAIVGAAGGGNMGNAAGPPGGCCPCNPWILDNI